MFVILGVVSTAFLVLGLSKIIYNYLYPNLDDSSSEEDSRPGTPVSTSEEEGYVEQETKFEEESSQCNPTESSITDVRTIIENYQKQQ